MSLDRISSPLLPPRSAPARPTAPPSREGEARPTPLGPDATRSLEAPARSSARLAPAERSLPADAPAGTDPALWSVLTSDERAFFAKTAALGPLTYGRIKSELPTAAPTARGARIDVRA
jgi:hypothetical protein